MKKSRLKTFLLKLPFTVKVYHGLRQVLAFPGFVTDYFRFKSLNKNSLPRFSLSAADWLPELLDKTATTPFEPHYTYHPAWAARILSRTKPDEHVDISSTLQFCAIVSAFIKVKFYDYRPAPLKLDNLFSGQADLLNLPFSNNSIMSLSCMHTVEHVGLGRYGDQLDPEGDVKACKELARVLAPGGCFLFVTPVGKPRLQFNAHRIYSYEQVMENFKDLQLKEFSLVPDNFEQAGLIANASPSLIKEQEWGCGCFWFTKL